MKTLNEILRDLREDHDMKQEQLPNISAYLNRLILITKTDIVKSLLRR